ncbi:MAG: sodium:solute symporter family protein [Cyclobacteriaceae bacterium]|nr:sodium:solute symporter family protein [Cyclobacteriaceae bacterium]MCH8514891.1 sodium:solute symporter family protein [Cyclobacteriaceae bacterium]
MSSIDAVIFIVYILGMLGVGFYFLRKNEKAEDYYVGGRGMSSWHIGLSVVATDVGGGFSIGLGGLGFLMGISGSWMLFTGLLGAWLAAVFLIPAVRGNQLFDRFYTFPQILEHFYSSKVAILAGVISAIGYTGFTASQLLAGAKLASGTFPSIEISTALYIMGGIAVIYTVIGGIKAVIYTDTFQWIILLAGLIFIGIPLAYIEVGGINEMIKVLPPEFFKLNNLTWQQFINWMFTIIPIWFIGMTLYQRIYASRDVKTARKAWFIAGLFEWPIMAFMGVALGLMARVAAMQGAFDGVVGDGINSIDEETGLPMLLATVLPIGLMGLMMSAYFSAILSTADSCLMAASGNVMTDLLNKKLNWHADDKKYFTLSKIITLIIGMLALLLASHMTRVLDLMLVSYAFMVSAMFIPVVMALFFNQRSESAAFWSMLVGGSTTISMSILSQNLKLIQLPFGLDPIIFGISASLVTFLILKNTFQAQKNKSNSYGISGN